MSPGPTRGEPDDAHAAAELREPDAVRWSSYARPAYMSPGPTPAR